MTQVHSGRCLCGAVTFQAAGPAKWTGYCHCASCRRHTGAPVSAFAGFERGAVTFSGEPLSRYTSSAGVQRGFCARCGSTMTYEGDRWPTEIHLHVGALDDPESFAPQGHAFPEERLSWLHLEVPPAQA
jgi:hypothetical protein